MKKFWYLFAGAAVLLATAACDGGDDAPSGLDCRVSAPVVTKITGSTAQVTAGVVVDGSAAAVWDFAETGFLYKEANSIANAFTEKRCKMSGGMASAKIDGLRPETDYLVRFFLKAEGLGIDVLSEETAFRTTTSAGPDPDPDPTPDPDPDPDPDPAPAGKVYRTGWPELPTEDAANADYRYAHHICPDFRAGGHLARNYTVCFSAQHHCPVWVAAPRHRCYESGASRTDAYGPDPQIPANLQYNSKSTGGGCNKGHMLGSAERLATSATNRQVFYYTNIAPQYTSTFNTGGGAWNNLEDWIDEQVCADTTYVVIGTYFDRYTDRYGNTATPKKISFGGRNDVSCPTMFYYAVLRTKRGNTGKSVRNCSASELKCAAFVLSHKCPKGHEPQSRDMMSIAELEALTGHTFFANVPNAPKSSCSAADWGL